MPKPTNAKKHTTASKKLKVTITANGERGFFARGKEIAKLADEGKSIPQKHIINFDSPEEVLAILTKAIRSLMALLREGDASIPDIVHLLHRDRAAIASALCNRATMAPRLR